MCVCVNLYCAFILYHGVLMQAIPSCILQSKLEAKNFAYFMCFFMNHFQIRSKMDIYCNRNIM